MFDVRPWSIDELKKLFDEKSMATPARIDRKFHSRFFEEYFGATGLKAKAIVVQDSYVDRDYLEDFAAYYVRCFHGYERKCTRLHFFAVELQADDLEKLVVGEAAGLTQDELQSAYLGFIVIRNLPQTVIGRTCLRPYDHDGWRRRYPITREYKVSLYGIPLTIETLGFQEQDTVAGACATSALWTIFQGTGKTFQHAIPSPVEVSNFADHHRRLEARLAPSRGLSDEQAVRAIEEVGLVPHQVAVPDSYTLITTLYAYLRGNIPLYLGVRLYNAVIAGQDIDGTTLSLFQGHGGHAIALTGFSLGGAAEVPVGDFRLRATRIDKVYAHDDQVGPFARMAPKLFQVHWPNDPDQGLFALTTEFPSEFAGMAVIALPEIMIVPLYHKIRIPYDFVQKAVISFDAVMKDALNKAGAGYDSSKFTWDIFLVTGASYMDKMRTRGDLARAHRLALATESLPRFFWHASLFYDGNAVMTVLFDATDLEQGDVVVHIVEEDAGFSAAARMLAASPALKAQQELAPNWRIWNWFNKNP